MKKRIIAIFLIVAVMSMAILPLNSYAWYSGRPQLKTSTSYKIATEQLTHNGLVWDVDTTCTKTVSRTSDNGTRYNYDDDGAVTANPPAVTTTVGRINELGNLEISTKDKPDIQPSTYYRAYLYSSNNEGTEFNSTNFQNDHDFEIKFKYSDRLQLYLNTGGSVPRDFDIDFFTDSKIYYKNTSGSNRSLEADAAWNQWHILKLSTRKTKSGSVKMGTISLDGKELITYELPNSKNGASSFYARTYHHAENHYQNLDENFGTPDQHLEIEYVTMTPVTASSSTSTGEITLSGITDGQVLNVGDEVTLKTSESANGGILSSAKVSKYYISNGVVGEDRVSSWPSRTNSGFAYKFTEAGIYKIYGEYNGKKSAVVTVRVVKATGETATITVPKSANYGEGVGVSVETDATKISSYEYYVNGKRVKTSSSANETLTGLRAGTAAVMAKVIRADGRELATETKYIDINKGAVASGENVNMHREYRLDYEFDGSAGSTLSVNDGYFKLDFIYGDNKIEYIDNTGSKQVYTGVGNGIGAGDYRIVATAGNAEVYYNGQFLFSLLMPYTNSGAQSITYSGGITGVELFASGVKQERFFAEWNTKNSVEEYGLDFEMWYSMEFNKDDTQDETVVVYDGQYQGKIVFDERGVTAVTQTEDYKTPEETLLSATIKPGYYRLTVAVGLAQLFVDNVFIASFKMPYNPHKQSVMRSEIASAVPRMASVKNANDVYYHKESFDGDTEYPASEYWFSEEEARAVENGQEDPFTQEYITEGGNGYLKITDVNMQKPFYADEAEAADSTVKIDQPVADWNLNAVAINPRLSWRAKADGSGEIHFIVRHYKKGFFVSVSYDFAAGQWKLNRYSLKNKSLSFTADPQKENIDGDVSITKMLYLSNEVLATSDAASPGTDWNDYTMVVDEENITLTCGGEVVLNYSGLYKGHGKMGFGVSGGAALCIDDVEYEGDGKASPGFKYFSIDEMIESSYKGIYTAEDGTVSTKNLTTVHEQGVKDFYKVSDEVGVVASGSIKKPYSTNDGGRTWNKMLDSGGHHEAGGIGYNTLNLLSGGFMTVTHSSWGSPRYDEWLGKEILDYNYGTNRLISQIYPSGKREKTLNGTWPQEDLIIDPASFPSGLYHQSNIASQLVQAYNGEYRGRLFITKGIGGERYGGEVMFYTDADRNIINAGGTIADYWTAEAGQKKKINDVWKESSTLLTYENTGVDFAESKVVALEDCIRIYGRTSNGFICYCTSYDGGDTWSKATLSQFIAPRCSYGITNDPQNPETYYAFWSYDTNTVLKAQDGGSPRNRVALAVSNDGMKTWQYVMDVEEFTYNFTLQHDGETKLDTWEDHGMRVIDGVVYVDYDGQGKNFTKLFTIDTQKIKPLKRFTSVHEKTIKYTDGGGLLWERAAVLPKNGGKGSIYGASADVVVTDGVYDKTILALAVDLTETEVSGLSVAEAAELGEKNLVETDGAYIISDMDLSRVSAHYVESLGMEKDFETDNRDDILNRFNVAADYGQTDKMAVLLGAYSETLGFEADLSKTDVIEKMCNFSYYKVEDIGKVYSMLCKVENSDSALVLSTVSGGFSGWETVAENGAAETSIATNAASVAAKAAYTTQSEFGTAAFEVPDCDAYALNFDIKVGDSKKAAVKWGNYGHNIQLALNSGADFAKKQDEIPAEVDKEEWYNFAVLVQKSGNEWKVTVKKAEIASDGTAGEYTDSVFENVTGTKGRPGLWLEVLDGTAAIRNVRLYTDTAVEVLSFSANNGVAQAEVEILNFDKELSSAEVIMNLFNDNVAAGVSVSEALTEPLPVLGTKKMSFSTAYEAMSGVNPKAKFHIWKDTLNLQPLAEPISGIAMNGAVEDNFSNVALDTTKWSMITDSDGAGNDIYAGISADDGGVLKLKKDIAGIVAIKANFKPQPDNAVLMFDFKADAMPRLLQQQWYGNVYVNAEGNKVADRVVFYLQEAPSNGRQTIYCSSTTGYQHYDIEEGCWYSLAVEASGAGSSREYKFYLKKRGDSDYERLWSDATFVGSASTGVTNANSLQLYENNKYTDDQSTIANIVDVSIDNFRVVNGAFVQ